MPGLSTPICEERIRNTGQEQFESSLSAYISEVWQRNRNAKIEIEQKMLKSLRQINGEYDPNKLALIRMTKGSEVFSQLTYIKYVAASAWLSEAYSQARGRCYELRPTPIPDLSPATLQQINNRVLEDIFQAAQVYQNETGVKVYPEQFNKVAQAYQDELKEQEINAIKTESKKAVDKMSAKIEDQLTEGKWESNFKDTRSDIVAFGTGIIKGPIARKKKALKWINTLNGWSLDVVDKVIFEYERISPLDIYPEDDAVDIQDGDLIEYMRMSRKDFGNCIGLNNFNSDYIKQVLRDTSYGRGTISQLPTDYERNTVEGRYGQTDTSKRIGVINYWGSVPGRILLDWGMDQSQVPDADLDYDINAWFVEGTKYVVKAVINKTGIKPYSKACFERIPGAFWGKSLPEILRDDQDMCNGTVRAIQNNEAFSSLPISEVDISKVVDGENTHELWAGRTFQTDTKGMNSGPVVRFYQPPSVVGELLSVYEKFSRSMGEKSGIPDFVHGNTRGGGVTSTASGISMFLGMAGKIINDLINDIDTEIVATTIERTYNYNMLYDSDISIKGDANVVIRGISALSVKEQEEIRKAEFIRDTNNPTDMQIIGLEGRAELLRNRIRSISSLEAEKIVPDKLVNYFPATSKGHAPQEKPVTLDVSGNPSGGTEVGQFNSVSQRGGI